MTSSPPVPRPGRDVRGIVVEALARGIADGTYGAGTLLEPSCLTIESTTVARAVFAAAVRVLVAKDMVDETWQVRPESDWNLLDRDVLRWTLAAHTPPAPALTALFGDLHELRRSVEPSAAALAAQHRSNEDLAALDEALTAMAVAERSLEGDPVRAAGADVAFHSTLLRASGNRFFTQLLRVIGPALGARSRLVFAGPHHHPVASHAEVADRVREMDADGAYTAMLELLDLSLRDDP
ncbi:FadR/GntR family transcriptional regulator [Streptomyces sp. KL116D]|uniref:FadR/GntR family transcriptional regulator n=1 Tax=Streptomyces sp. KL116D TaxID=3045152 RepID=UPI0035562C77